jgi:hypothetical protein
MKPLRVSERLVTVRDIIMRKCATASTLEGRKRGAVGQGVWSGSRVTEWSQNHAKRRQIGAEASRLVEKMGKCEEKNAYNAPGVL